MNTLSEILANPDAGGVYLTETSIPTHRIQNAAEENGLKFFRIEGKDVNGKHKLLIAAAAALGFPDHFGNNWDAFEDCLRDMSWQPAAGYVILWDALEPMLRDAPGELGTALDIFKDCVEFWKENGKGMFIMLRGSTSMGLELPLIDAQGIVPK